ncbi:MAG TPA: sensor histidine kinase, partial [Verrucomicrobiae bacterium]|nr:sensor histidine kinase [Verrucomicrobiae bacterium]
VNVLDLIAEDQRPAAQHWLDKIVEGADMPTAEWDFINTSGQRVKLEISSRLIKKNSRKTEVEGTARDITERRRLERELLEISSREQRRIGHDLHDGVCQQLAGIAYLVNIMGNQMQRQGTPQARQAEKISGLINEVTLQARSVARGLFPVRLEELGLVFSLEEMAANARNRFGANCEVNCEAPPLITVDNETALHLYYIAQEAVLNALNHGKAKHVTVSLKPEGAQYNLTVSDDGSGFENTSPGSGGMGIRIMHYRAKVIGATLNVKSRPGQGTQVVCIFYPAKRETAREVVNG